MPRKMAASTAPIVPISLGENPVNHFHARVYAKESSPSIVAVILELTENARDNATDITLTIDVASVRVEHGVHYLTPNQICCTDNGTGLSHAEFLNRFCGAFSESESHHDVERAGRNGVGTKTYTSIADRVIVRTTTGRHTDGLDAHSEELSGALPAGLTLPGDDQPDSLWRVYEFRLHTRAAIPGLWSIADPREMGTHVELCEIRQGTEIPFEVLLERLSYARDWLQNSSHNFVIQLTGHLESSLGGQRRLSLKPWSIPVKNWLVEAKGRSDQDSVLFDKTTNEKETIPPMEADWGVIEFDFRVVGKTADGQMQNLDRPALLLEICGALPYAPNLGAVTSARTLPLLTFLGLEHASSIGAFCNAVCGWARVNSLALKEALRNNKTTLASGPGTEAVEELRQYLHSIFKVLHRAWYNATRSSQDEAAKDALREAQEEVNLALKGAERNPYKGGNVTRDPSSGTRDAVKMPPTRRHRWECGGCGKRWLATADFTPSMCAEDRPEGGKNDGCGSKNIGLAKNQPRIGDCQIKIEQLGDRRIPASFQFERFNEDLEVPVVHVNLVSPRYIELRGTGSMSAQAQKRLKQFLVDVSLVAIAEFHAKLRGADFSEELGELYFNRMLRCVGIKQYEAQVGSVLKSSESETEQLLLVIT